MTYFIVLAIYALTLFARRKELTSAEKWLLWLAPITLFSEIICDLLARRTGNNMPVFHIYTVVELFCFCYFFNEAVPRLKKYNVGKWIALGGLLLAALNLILWQSIFSINSIVLLYESFFMCAFCLIAISDILRSDQPGLLHSRLLWITGIMLAYHAFAFSYWTLYPLFLKYLSKHIAEEVVPSTLLWVNLFFYTALTIIFGRGKKLVALRKASQDY